MNLHHLYTANEPTHFNMFKCYKICFAKIKQKKKQIQFKIDPHPNTLESYTRSSLKKYISACNVRTRARAAQLSARQ